MAPSNLDILPCELKLFWLDWVTLGRTHSKILIVYTPDGEV